MSVPPLFKLLAANVMSRRRDQMIEDYRVLLAPAKPRDRDQIVAIK